MGMTRSKIRNPLQPGGAIAALALLAATWLWVPAEIPLKVLWPAVVAIASVFLLRRVLAGLLLGGLAGALLLESGNPAAAILALFRDHLAPTLASTWNLSVLAFTLLLGGFAALVERGGGFQGLLRGWLQNPRRAARRVQWSAFGLGLVCFFDGLANAMLVGRTLSPLARRVAVSAQKLAYLVDSTSAAVACVAVISTWIAYQLAMIRAGYEAVGLEVNAYQVFLGSIPLNFYCWFTIALLAVVIQRSWNLGPMAEAEDGAKRAPELREESAARLDAGAGVSPLRALAPLAVLLLALLGGLYASGAERPWPITFQGLMDAFGNADAARVLVSASALACLVAFAFNPRDLDGRHGARVFGEGVRQLLTPALILIGAWVLSSTLQALDASTVITALLAERMPVGLFPAAVFLTGAVVSFTTGTSWGTMGVLMPLALPVALTLTGDASASSPVVAGTVAGVFSGAVFGDHCSPLSDTTIVSSIACGIEPFEHVRTQLPYALLAAIAAALIGFLPAGFGVSAWLLLPAGFGVLALLPAIVPGGRAP
jgi:Na+/H+ antiporter NhaC